MLSFRSLQLCKLSWLGWLKSYLNQKVAKSMVLVSGLLMISAQSLALEGSVNSSNMQVIGQVMLMTGKDAVLIRNNQALPLKMKADILEGDSLQTQQGTFVHLKMKDNARISLRPQSQLEIVCYQVQQQSKGCMKLTLKQGEVRVVDGDAAKLAPETFRLNTPVAAIGVKGTDFVVSSTLQESLVRVLEGAVVASPFGGDCTANGLGVCTTSLSSVLSALDPYALRVTPGVLPLKVPLDNLPDVVAQKSLKQLQALAGQDLEQSSQSSSAASPVTDVAVTDVATILADSPLLVEKFLTKSLQYFKESSSVSSVPVSVSQDIPLVFSYWTNDAKGLNVPIDSAREGRSVTVGDNQTVLWRNQGEYLPMPGVVNYGLKAAEGFLYTQGDAKVVGVLGGALKINFDSRLFQTRLDMLMPGGAFNSQSIESTMARDDGIFALKNQMGVTVNGAISNDGQAVGYILNQQSQDGLLKVQTLWQSNSVVP
ncbi:FecR family protein [Thiosulfativibrio zosterae]|uniref:FecR protein domain-containing protein n=1 Tax=Thiosulfativibrio zosterae TaxID=2675053 RepID=A0A6F8PQ95_9GAMM|nr:FecR family protein [Thiosulfativibrio zosterae]BBP44302.1 hypothetical protein THMIRHAT_20480 [Thiosulfativibrio zosterae]